MQMSYNRIPPKLQAIASLSLLPNPAANGLTIQGNSCRSYFIMVAFTRSDVLTTDSFLRANKASSGSIIMGPSHLTYVLAYFLVMKQKGRALMVIQTTLQPAWNKAVIRLEQSSCRQSCCLKLEYSPITSDLVSVPSKSEIIILSVELYRQTSASMVDSLCLYLIMFLPSQSLNWATTSPGMCLGNEYPFQSKNVQYSTLAQLMRISTGYPTSMQCSAPKQAQKGVDLQVPSRMFLTTITSDTPLHKV